ncbi:MAG: HAMP domain-containing sensor histidine kinase [Bacteroidales bacterium]
MNKNRIIIIIVIAAFAMMGLIVLQVQWVRKTLEVRNASFEDSVDDAIQSVIEETEQKQIKTRLKHHFSSTETIDQLIDTIYSANKLIIHYRDTADLSTQGSVKEERSLSSHSFRNNSYQQHEALQKLLNRSGILRTLFLDLMGLDHPAPLKKRLEPEFIDSLINRKFKAQGIETPYVYGIIKSMAGEKRSVQFIYTNQEGYKQKLKNTSFSYDLFPNDIFREPVYLNIHFPKKHKYILSQMSLMLILSAILIVLLIGSFYYTIITIFRQKKLSEMKNDFINNMTHEFKTPISTISLACQTLGDEEIPKNEAIYKRYINVIDEENTRLGSMAEKILQTAIIDKGSMELKLEVINMHDVIYNAIKKIRMQVEQKDGVLKTELNAHNPLVRADKFHMTNVVFNLLDNANKYSINTPHITIRSKNTQNGFKLEVRDNGIGISKAHQKKIFEKLYRIPTGNIHDVKGFGLGLSYVKAILDKHNGSIHIQSELNKGSTFTIIIPFQPNEIS